MQLFFNAQKVYRDTLVNQYFLNYYFILYVIIHMKK